MATIQFLLLLLALIADHPRLLLVKGHPLTNGEAEIATTTEFNDESTTISNDVKNDTMSLISSDMKNDTMSSKVDKSIIFDISR